MRGQLITFELLSGLFGWVWIATSVVALICVGFALLGDWSWWNVLYAVIVGGVAKWLARGFLDNKRRVLYEQKLIDEGLTKEEAAQRWLEEFQNGGQ